MGETMAPAQTLTWDFGGHMVKVESLTSAPDATRFATTGLTKSGVPKAFLPRGGLETMPILGKPTPIRGKLTKIQAEPTFRGQSRWTVSS